MTHLDLFSGIGGFALAAQWVWGEDHNIHSFVEIDPFCQKVLKKHWPDVPIISDIKELTADTFVNLCYEQLSTHKKEIIDMQSKQGRYDEAINLYNKGLSIQDIANYYKITRQAMWMILKRRGCVFRDNKKYGKENHFFRGGSTASSRVHDIVELAVEKGLLIRKTHCEKCNTIEIKTNGKTNIEAHHCDYNIPLDVQWLCAKCHYEWHTQNKAKKLEIDLPKMTRKEICSLGGKASNEKRKEKMESIGEIEDATNVDLLTGGFP